MNPQFRTVALVAAALGLLVSLFLVLRPSDEDETTPTTATATASAAPTAEPTPPPLTSPTGGNTPVPLATATPTPPAVVTIRIAVTPESAGTVRRFSVKRGRKVELIVASTLADEIHVHGYDLMADVAPGMPAKISFTADAAGVFEIELEGRGLPIAELEVRP